MTLHIKRRNKYGNIKVVFRGITFDSKKEAARYQELLLLELAGKIDCLERQRKYVLQEGFRYGDGKWILPITCKWDFWYREYYEGRREFTIVAEDVKSPPTRKKEAYVIRKKLFMKRYPEIEFREV